MNLQSIIYANDLDNSFALQAETLTRNRESFEVESRCVRKDEKTVWLHCYVSLSLGRDSELAHWWSVITDIIDANRNEQMLVEQQSMHEQAEAFADIGSWQQDDRGPMKSQMELREMSPESVFDYEYRQVKASGGVLLACSIDSTSCSALRSSIVFILCGTSALITTIPVAVWKRGSTCPEVCELRCLNVFHFLLRNQSVCWPMDSDEPRKRTPSRFRL